MIARAPQFKRVFLGNEVGSDMVENEPLRLGCMSFASKLMDLNSIKVFAFEDNLYYKNGQTAMG